jgi:hypothetical protein
VDRGSAFADKEVVDLLKESFVSVGISLQEDLKAQDPTGEFFRKIVDQRPEPKHSKQGYYIASPDGTLLRGWMYPRPDNGTVKKNLKEAIASYKPPTEIEPLDESKADPTYKWPAPEGLTIVETRTKIFDAVWPAAVAERFEVIKGTMGHDRLWITKPEVEALEKGGLADSLLERIIRFHLGDNTRCYIDRWAREAMQKVHVEIKRDGQGFVLDGSVSLEQGARGYNARLSGFIEVKGGAINRFDLLAQGKGWGQHNGVNYAPVGKFTIVNAFSLAKPGVTFDVRPVWNWVPEYMATKDLRVGDLRSK